MAQKSNIRSIRFSDEMAELIDRQAGTTFTQKFENLITRCVWELPKKEEQIQYAEKQIAEKRQELQKLRMKYNEAELALRKISERIISMEVILDNTIDAIS